MSIEVRVPALGESVTEATVATWFKKPGDAVAADEMLCELETDTVTVEVPAPSAGTLGEIVAAEGSTVGPNALLATISEGTSAAPAPAAAPAKALEPAAAGVATAPQDSPATHAAPTAAPSGPANYGGASVSEAAAGADVEDAPSAKKMMADQGLSRDQVPGTGRDGRVMKEDVLRVLDAPRPAAASAPAAQAPRAPTAAGDVGREERVKMTRLRQTIARRLKEAQNTAAMLTTYNEADMSAIMALRNEYKDAFEKKHKVKLGFMSFFVKACVHALQEVPEVNAEID
ncbi:MAG TPA: 2-oxo acid dehydrogenase subunit E2, partial [Rubellimicrobium sp.]|nr:2-oxo acid dehydrogenase subunit E2 [Rubellimicrobium sp.]